MKRPASYIDMGRSVQSDIRIYKKTWEGCGQKLNFSNKRMAGMQGGSRKSTRSDLPTILHTVHVLNANAIQNGMQRCCIPCDYVYKQTV